MKKVFSFCLYNDYTPFYYDRLIANVDIIHKYFSGWDVFVYIGNDVPSWFQEKLKGLGCELRDTNAVGDLNMVHRYFAIDEEDVEVMIVRDADSLIHWKDRWAIQRFLESDYKFHGIRDSDVHYAYIMGGLWGMKKQEGISIQDLYQKYAMSGEEYNGKGNDQKFLRLILYPIARPNMLIHYSHESVTFPNENLVKFPFEWSNTHFCGNN